MLYVYILKSRKDEDLYVGSTSDLKRRFDEHQKGKVQSTRLRVPFDLIYYETYKAEGDARKREQGLKYRGQALRQLKERISESLLL